MSNIILSVIIPVRANDNYNIIERISYKTLDTEISDNIEFVVVDDGSNEKDSIMIKEECLKLNMKYIYIDSRDRYFSLARARNKGVQYAQGKYVLIEDVDFAPYKGYYNDIIYEIELFDLEHNQEDFFTIPGIWLSEKASQEFLNNNSRNQAKKMIQKYLEFDMNYFEHGVPTGSVLVMSRHHYLSIGGQNELFNRWGFEDHEFAERLLTFSNKFPDPVNKTKYIDKLYIDYVNYEGFRARYRLYGDLVSAQGIYNFHIHHPISSNFRNDKIKKENRELFNQCVEKIAENNYYLNSLSNFYRGKTCITSKNPFIYNNELFPLYGEVYFFDDGVHTKEEFYQFICDNKIDRVVMQNPYSNEKKLTIYKYLKDKNIECIVGERGALPESIYFDKTGFCCESNMYKEELWNKDLSDEQYKMIISYIQEYKASGSSLEKQAACVSGKVLRQQNNIAEDQKILFVVFQTRQDATVKYFSGKIGSYDNFITLVNDVRQKLPKDWVLCYKNHPLEPIAAEIPNAICLDKYHINDILEASDMVLLMNSGCGILSLLYNVPVLHVSEAQYDCKYFNRYISSSDEVIHYCNNMFTVDNDKTLKFLYYLVFEFYSFAINICKKRQGKPDSWPIKLIFKKIIFPECDIIFYNRDKSKAIWRKSILFDRYRVFLNKLEDEKKNKNSAKPEIKKNIVKTTNENKKDLVKVLVDKDNKMHHPIEGKIIKIFSTNEKYKKYLENRNKFFSDSKSILVKKYYELVK